MQSQVQKTPGKKAEFYPSHLDWFVSNGMNVRDDLSSVYRHEKNAEKYGNVLLKRSLRASEKEMDGYLTEYRAASDELRGLAARLVKMRGAFLADKQNKSISPEGYDSVVEGMRRKAEFFEKRALEYENEYTKKYGIRAHFLVRDIARQLREEMERNAGKPSSPPLYRKGPERAAFAQNTQVEPVSRETHALVSSYMQGLQKKYSKEPSEKGEERVASADNSGYKRRSWIVGMENINAAASRRENEERSAYHLERQIRPRERGQTAIARRSVPAKGREEANRIARISTLKTAPSLADAREKIERLRAEKAGLNESLASLSGAEKQKKAKQLAELNKELYKLRKLRDSLV